MDRDEFLRDLRNGYLGDANILHGPVRVHLHLLLLKGRPEWAIRGMKSKLCGTIRCRMATLTADRKEALHD